MSRSNGDVRKRKVTTVWTQEPPTPVNPSWSRTQHNTAGSGRGWVEGANGRGKEMWLTTEEFYTLLPEVSDNGSGQIVFVFKYLDILTEPNKE